MLRLQEAGTRDPSILRGQVEPARDLTRAAEALEGTYLTRMFAEFETGVTALLGDVAGLSNPATLQRLLNSLAGQRTIPDTDRDNAHLVREYRNSLVHEREGDDLDPVPIALVCSEVPVHVLQFPAPRVALRVNQARQLHGRFDRVHPVAAGLGGEVMKRAEPVRVRPAGACGGRAMSRSGSRRRWRSW